MTEDTIRIAKTETKIYDVDISEAPDYVDNLEDWAKDQVLTNTAVAERNNDLKQGTSLEMTDEMNDE